MIESEMIFSIILNELYFNCFIFGTSGADLCEAFSDVPVLPDPPEPSDLNRKLRDAMNCPGQLSARDEAARRAMGYSNPSFCPGHPGVYVLLQLT